MLEMAANASYFMKGSGKSQPVEARTPKRLMMAARKHLRIGYWNARTTFQTSMISQIMREMDNYVLKILDISENRLTRCGQEALLARKENCHWFKSL